MKLSKANIDRLTLAPGQSELIKSSDDVPGLRIRLRDNGSRTWEYKYGKVMPRITIGRYPAVDVTGAHKTAKEFYAKVILGQNPAREKAEAKARSAETFGACVEVYLERRRHELRAKTLVALRRHLTRNLAPLHNMNITAVDRKSIAAQLSRIATTAPVQANRTLTSVHKFLEWAIGEGLIESNPATGCNKAAENDARDRHLNPDEIRALWEALPARGDDYGDILKLLLLTGQRQREIADLTWNEINFDRGVIELPGERTKNHRPHTIPMSDTVSAILQARSRRPDRDLVFGASCKGGFSGWGKAKARLDAKLNFKMPWVVHDLRRTAATGMAELGVQPHVVEAVLNHVSGSKSGVAGIYNRSTYESEKRTALTLWADHVAGEPDKIVPMRRA
jgi:integrase